jgi:hypothetical protein
MRRPAHAGYTQHKEDGSLTSGCPSGKTEFFSLNDENRKGKETRGSFK